MNKEFLKKIQSMTSETDKKMFGDTFSTQEMQKATGYSKIKALDTLREMIVSKEVKIVKVTGRTMGGFGNKYTFTRYQFIGKDK